MKYLKVSIIVFLLIIGGSVMAETRCNNVDLKQYAKDNNIPTWKYNDSLIELYEKNSDTQQFVFEYPNKRYQNFEINLEEYENSSTVPLLMQWDQRWGYKQYSGDMIGLTGCGPTCLSMVAIYLTGDTTLNPKVVADFATNYGYSVEGNGTAWTLFSEGAKELGIEARELPLDEYQVIKNLQAGNPIICSMGPGDFTTTGHFIVMTEYKNGKIMINDPNSYQNSEKQWEYKTIKGQIKNLWVCSKSSI